MASPTISVVMPFRNRKGLISQSIQSILSQTYADFELICVDDGTTDGADEYVKKFAAEDPRVRLLINNGPPGISGAANLGFFAARSDLIVRMDSDDIATPHRLSTQFRFMNSHPEVGLVGSWVRTFGAQGVHEWRLPIDHDDIRAQMVFCGALAQPAVMFRKTRFLEHGLLYEPKFSVTEDYDLWSRAAIAIRCANIPQVLLFYRTHAENVSTERRSEIVALTKEVQRRQLQKMGIEVCDNYIDLHWRISDHNPDGKPDFYDRAFQWLNLIDRQNRRSAFVETAALRRYLDEKRRWVREHEVLAQPEAPQRHLVYVDTATRSSKHLFDDATCDSDRDLSSLDVRGYRALSRAANEPIKIGMAILIHERPEYLERCLDSLFSTIVPGNMELTVALVDDGSIDPRVQMLIDLNRDTNIKIVRCYTPKSANNWGAAFNKAIRLILGFDTFDIIGTSDSDALFHPEWLSKLVSLAMWAKVHHKDHAFGPFSAFNSSDIEFHDWQGVYPSPEGDFVIKNRMGALNYLYFIEDFVRLGFFSEDRDDETKMTLRFSELGILNLSTNVSYIEHLGQDSVLNRWRPTPVRRAVYGLNLPKYRWPSHVRNWETVGYFKDVVTPVTMMDGVQSQLPLSVVYVCLDRDAEMLELSIRSVKEFLRHPISDIVIVGDQASNLPEISRRNGVRFVSERELIPNIRSREISYETNGNDRSGWLYQQLLKFSADAIFDQTHYLILDADTMLARHQVFEFEGKDLILHAAEFHPPYFSAYARLVGCPPATLVSSVSHQALINRRRLRELKTHIETDYGVPWYRAILSCVDYAQASGFSEYETYAQWCIMNYHAATRREFFFNTAVPRDEAVRLGFEGLVAKFGASRSLSMHWYL
jgi:glycosyltransferase involved in cell wall biosynthesis